MAAEVALEVRPAHLALVGVEMAVAVPAIGDHDPWVGADQRVELLVVAVLGDLHKHPAGGGRGPQRSLFANGSPAGLIDMHRSALPVPALQGAGAGRPTPQTRWQIASTAPAIDSVTPNRSRASSAGHRAARIRYAAVNVHQRRLQPRPERRGADLLRQGGGWSVRDSAGNATGGCDARSRSR